jgi:hypothetical protein
VWRATREFSAFGDLLAGVGWGALDFSSSTCHPGWATFQYAESREAAAFVPVRSRPTCRAGGVARDRGDAQDPNACSATSRT